LFYLSCISHVLTDHLNVQVVDENYCHVYLIPSTLHNAMRSAEYVVRPSVCHSIIIISYQ